MTRHFWPLAILGWLLSFSAAVWMNQQPTSKAAYQKMIADYERPR